MSDLRLAVQDAVHEVLEAGFDGVMAEGRAVRVYQHAPDDAQPPLIILGDISASPIGGKDGGLDSISFEILTFYRGPARRHLMTMQARVRTLLEGIALPPQPGAALTEPLWQSSDDDMLEDGITYAGVQRFTLIAQDA